MTTRIVRTEQEKRELIRVIENRKPPFTATLVKGAPRTIDQNKLQRLWLNEAAEQLGEDTAEGYRAFCKLHFGVPILRNENDAFRAQYDRIVKPLPYEHKLEVMKEPLDFPVTRLMTTKQKTQYLEEIYQHFRGLGVQLTEPRRG